MTQLPGLLAARSVLHIGSGMKYMTDAVNLDITPSTKPDIVHDLDILPWPLPNDHFTEVRAFDVIEHLDDLVATMEEIHRVCVNGATIRITTPHFSCANAFTDITHRHYFSVASFNYFTGDNEFAFYSSKRFRRVQASIIFAPTLLNKLVWRMAARWPTEYERRWAWIFPAWFLSFELQVIKTGE
ncbi:MAG: hypothetical protein ABJC63_00120 [Gemmatimonadales bacterium]